MPHATRVDCGCRLDACRCLSSLRRSASRSETSRWPRRWPKPITLPWRKPDGKYEHGMHALRTPAVVRVFLPTQPGTREG